MVGNELLFVLSDRFPCPLYQSKKSDYRTGMPSSIVPIPGGVLGKLLPRKAF